MIKKLFMPLVLIIGTMLSTNLFAQEEANTDISQEELLFIHKNLTDAERLELSTTISGQMAMTTNGEEQKTIYQKYFKKYRAILSQRGIVFAGAAKIDSSSNKVADTRPKIDLKEYQPLALPKQNTWMKAEPSDGLSGTGFYREESNRGTINKIRVGIWETYEDNDPQGILKTRGCYNNQGIKIGPQLTYYTSGPTSGKQVKEIEVCGGKSLEDKVDGVLLTDATKNIPVKELLKFHPDGSLAHCQKNIDDKTTNCQLFYPNGILMATGTTREGFSESQGYHKNGAKGMYNLNEQIRSATSIFTRSVNKIWNTKNDLSEMTYTQMIRTVEKPNGKETGFKITFPERDEATPETAKQQIVWNDLADEYKGASSAGFVVSDKDPSKVGSWVSWNEYNKITAAGSYKDGKKNGAWEEYEWAIPQSTRIHADTIATHKGKYANDVRVGIWQSMYDPRHPILQAHVKKIEEAAAARKEAAATLNDMNGYLETNTYVDGKVVKTDRNW